MTPKQHFALYTAVVLWLKALFEYDVVSVKAAFSAHVMPLPLTVRLSLIIMTPRKAFSK